MSRETTNRWPIRPREASFFSPRDHRLIQFLFTPLVAGWSVWAGIAISTRVSDVRAAQQLATAASLPPLGIVALMQFNVITPRSASPSDSPQPSW